MKMGRNNYKSSVIFDEKYGTSISHQYVFPFKLTADEIWNIIHEESTFNGEMHFSEKLKIIIANLDFPYIDINSLSDFKKYDLICGMASCFNPDDILWYLEGNYGCSPKSMEITNEMTIHLKGIVDTYFDIQWVVSRKTWERIKEQLLIPVI